MPESPVDHQLREAVDDALVSTRAIRRAYASVFAGPEGEMVLDDLKSLGYFDRSTHHVADDGGRETSFREGHRHFVLHILEMMREVSEEEIREAVRKDIEWQRDPLRRT